MTVHTNTRSELVDNVNVGCTSICRYLVAKQLNDLQEILERLYDAIKCEVENECTKTKDNYV